MSSITSTKFLGRKCVDTTKGKKLKFKSDKGLIFAEFYIVGTTIQDNLHKLLFKFVICAPIYVPF